MAEIDSLQISIEAKATKANDAIDRLVGKLDRLSISMGRMNTSNLNGLANGVDRLGRAMQTMNTVKTADFTRLATNLAKLGNINVSALNSTASSLSHLTRAFNMLGGVSANAMQVGELSKNLGKLGNKSVTNAITNIPKLAAAMSNLMSTLSKAPRVSQNVIQMTNALANLASQGSKVGSASNSIIRGLNGASASATRAKISFGGLASAIGKFYATYWGFIRGFKALGKAIESTADYVEAFNYFTVSIGKVASRWDSEWENYADENARNYSNKFFTTLDDTFTKLSGVSFNPETGLLSETGLKNLGLNLQEVTQYAAQLASMMDAVGQSGETTLATTNAFVKLAGDISSLYNIDYSEAASKMRSVLQGQSRAGYRFGWDTTAAALQTTADRLDLSKAVSEMSQYEKQQLRILTILEQSRVAWGDQSNTINTLANQMRIFKNNISEVGMTLGQLFVPILQKAMPIINGVTIAIKRLMASIAGFLGIKIEDTGQGFTSMEDDIDGVTDSLEDATAAAKKLKTTTLGIDELNINAPQDASGIGSGVAGGGIDLTDEILDATSEYEGIWDEAFRKMENLAEKFADSVEKFLKPIRDMFENLFSGNFEEAGKNLSEFFMQLMDIDWDSVYAKARGFGKGLAEFLNGLISPELFAEVGKTVAGNLNTALHFLNSFGKTFDWKDFGKSLANGVKGFLENWDAELTGETLSNFANGLLEALTSAINELASENVFEELGQKVVDFICAIQWGELTWNLYGLFEAFTKAVADFPYDFAKGISEGIASKITGEEINVEVPIYLEKGLKYLMSAPMPHIALMQILPSSDEYGKWFENDVAPWFKKERWASLWDDVKNSFFEKWSEIKDWWRNSAISIWFEEDVQPWFAKEKWFELGQGILDGILTKWSEFTEWWNGEAILVWWEESVMPWFSLETWYELADGMSQGIFTKWEELSKTWVANITKWWKTNVEPWFAVKRWQTLGENLKNGVFNGFKGIAVKTVEVLNSIIESFESMVDKVVDKVNDLIDKINDSLGDFIPNIPNISFKANFGRIPIPEFRTGGFPEDGLFMANHNELVGQFSNGKTAVANNEQIVAGIEYGVERAVERSLTPYLSYLPTIAQNTRDTADKDNSVYIGDRDIARANNRGQKALGRRLIMEV